jgi:hypothetical protein
MAVVFALIASLVLFGLIDLLTLVGWVDQEYEWEVPLEVSWGALFTFFLAGSYVWVARFPHAPSPAFVQLGISGLALLISAAAGADWRPLGLALSTAVSGSALWLLAGRQPVPLVGRPSIAWGMAAVALLGFPLWIPYSAAALTHSRAGELGIITQGVGHWPVQGAVGVALVLASLVLALWDDGRQLLRVAVSSSAVCIGMAELAYPDGDGTMGSILWGVCGTLWGLLVALVTVPRRGPATH